MSYSKVKIAAFTLGALAVCLAASAETPGLERIGCCSSAAWDEAIAAVPFAAASPASGGSYVERGAHHRWSLHVAGLSSPHVPLPPSVDRALRRAFGAPPGATPPQPVRASATSGGEEDTYEDSVTRWSLGYLVLGTPEDGLWWGGGGGGRRCHHHHTGSCHKHPPPPPPPGAVPEPSLWLLLFLGVAGIGAALRRSRRAVPPTRVARG